jgi:PKD repeat protein
MDNESLSCSPFPVSIRNLSTGTNLSYSFDLDDGPIINTANRDQVITHTYHNLTNDVQPYTITLTATTAFGCLNSTSQTIYSYPEVTANFSFAPGNAACSPFTVALNNASNNGYFYQWNFDDGTNSNLMSPSHRFVNTTENDKIFDVRLKSISVYDCEDDTTLPLTVYATPVANFSVDPPLKIYPDADFKFRNQSNPRASTWTYAWTFGDGYTSSDKDSVVHTYAKWGPKGNDYIYNSTLTIDAPHCSSTTSNILRLLPAEPIPFFTADIYNSCSPLEAHFINASQYGGIENGGNYVWDFGDGSPTSTEAEPIHVFTTPGYYNVKLKVIGDGGETFYFKTFRVYQNPIADFAVYPNRVMLPDATVHIYNLTKYGDHYEWDLGDNSPILTDRDPVYKYNELGEFRISLRAFAADSLGGCQDYTSKFPAVWVEGIGKIDFPNAFMPNKTGSNGGVYDDIDYKNEVFHPVHYGVVEYKLMIFNRWGEQVFQSDDVKIGWDGYFQSKLCDQGVYIWRAIGKYTNGKAFDRKGNVTLLR